MGYHILITYHYPIYVLIQDTIKSHDITYSQLITTRKNIMSLISERFITEATGQPDANAVRLLHIDTSIKATGSLTREMSAAAVTRLKRETAGIAVHYRDLAAHPLGDLTERVFAAHVKGANISNLDQAELSDLAQSGQVLEEFLTSQVIAIGVAFYNFTIPSSLKAWIDRICVAGKTFSYSASGVV